MSVLCCAFFVFLAVARGQKEDCASGIPGQVRNLDNSVNGSTATVKWDPPDDISCVRGYIVTYEEESYSTTETSYIIENIPYCTSHDVQVVALGSDDQTGASALTTVVISAPYPFDKVQNLKLTLLEDALKATWDPPENAGNCVELYKIEVWGQGGSNAQSHETSETYYLFTPLIGCMNYSVQVKPWINETMEGNIDSTEYAVGPRVTNPPTKTGQTLDKTWMNLVWGTDRYSENMCTIVNIKVSCTSSDTEPWVITNADLTVDVQDSSSRPNLRTNITELSEFTNYTCTAIVTNIAGPSEESIEYSLRTAEEVPYAPQNLIVLSTSSTTFKIGWEKPYKIPGVLKTYNIAITRKGEQHFIPENCPIDEQISLTQTLEADIYDYTFQTALPNFLYDVDVSASTGAGDGENASITVTTQSGTPEMPRSIEYSAIDNMLKWLLPCNTNGELDYFEITLTGKPTYEETEKVTVIDTTVNKNAQIEDIEYSFQITNINGSYDYDVEVRAVLKDGTKGEAAKINFISPVGYPGEPFIEAITGGSSYFLITWSEPTQKNGRLENYNISITSHGPLYPTRCDPDIQTYAKTVSADFLFYNFTEAKPYYNYSITVSASTSIGYGNESNEEVYRTAAAKPQPPDAFGYNLTEYDLAEHRYNVSGTIGWYVPCEVNGILDHFRVRIEAKSTLDNKTDAFEIKAADTGEFYFTQEFTVNKFHDYVVSVVTVLTDAALESDDAKVAFLAPIPLPGPPTLNDLSDITPNSFLISWAQLDTELTLTEYHITIADLGPVYEEPECSQPTGTYEYNVSSNQTQFKYQNAMPYRTYGVTVKAVVLDSFGEESDEKSCVTSRTASEPVKNLTYYVEYGDGVEYNPVLTVDFEKPCPTYGPFNYSITLVGERENKESHNITTQTIESTINITSLKPQYTYTINVQVLTEGFESEAVQATFTSQAGVPLGLTKTIVPPSVDGASTASYTFTDHLFNDTNGEIIYYAIILGIYGHHETPVTGTWDGTEDSWPSVQTDNPDDTNSPYQATPKMWNPFQKTKNAVFTFHIGTGNCSSIYEDCNKPLEPETEYAFKIRGFTDHGYCDSDTVAFVTDRLSSAKTATILGIVFGSLAAVAMVAFMVIIWGRRRQWFEKKKVSVIEEPGVPRPVPVKEFAGYYSRLVFNYNELKAEFTMLENKTKEITKSVTIANLLEHKGKNRYCNIKPFDETRVVLRKDANDNDSDYINASYLKGYSGKIEYIATQGPLAATCIDFWRMVLQENVTVIAMVAQCVEQNREKCYKYFPDRQETIIVGDDIEIRCLTDLNFGTYVIKHFLIQRDLEKHNVTHLQFLDWPDFGCPSETWALLEFCQLMRNCHNREGGKITVHCSAGVGRSGTLIAIDMLLQGVQANKDVDIFGTILNLRQQRPKMVQTEKQYAYIYRCINDAILNPMKFEETTTSEAIYENVEYLRNSSATSEEQLVKESML